MYAIYIFYLNILHKYLKKTFDTLTYRLLVFSWHKLQQSRWPIRWWHNGIRMFCSRDNLYSFSFLLPWSTHSLYTDIVWLLWHVHGCLVPVLKVNYMFMSINFLDLLNYIWGKMGKQQLFIFEKMHNYTLYKSIMIMSLRILCNGNYICRTILPLHRETILSIC